MILMNWFKTDPSYGAMDVTLFFPAVFVTVMATVRGKRGTTSLMVGQWMLSEMISSVVSYSWSCSSKKVTLPLQKKNQDISFWGIFRKCLVNVRNSSE